VGTAGFGQLVVRPSPAATLNGITVRGACVNPYFNDSHDGAERATGSPSSTPRRNFPVLALQMLQGNVIDPLWDSEIWTASDKELVQLLPIKKEREAGMNKIVSISFKDEQTV
jgi:hypothetical protein